MKNLLLITVCLLCCTLCAHAQQYKWLKGGGSTISSSISSEDDQVSYMCTDPDKNVYIIAVVGHTDILADTFHHNAHNTGGDEEMFVASYACDGTMRWAKLIESLNFSDGNGIAYSNGNIYIVGRMIGDNKYVGSDTMINDEYRSSFTAKFDTSGNFKWIRFVGLDSTLADITAAYSNNLAIDGHGYIHHYDFMGSGIKLTGSLTSVAGTYDLKYDSSGNLLSAKRMQIDSGWLIRSIVINQHNGKTYALIHWGPNDYKPQYIAAFDTSGSQLWADSVQGGSVNGFSDIAYDNHGNIYCAAEAAIGPFILMGDTVKQGYINGNLGLIIKLDTTGKIKWTFNLDFSTNDPYISSITLLPNGKIAAAGITAETARHGIDSIISTSVQNPLVVVLDTAANLITLDQLHGDGFYNWGLVITSDSFNNIYIGGEEENNLTAGSYTYSTHGGNTDFFVAKYGYNCDCTLDSLPSSSFTYRVGGTATFSFTFTGTTGADSVVWNFGNGSTATGSSPSHTYDSSGTYHVCATVYTGCGTTTACHDVKVTERVAGLAAFGNVQVYPNPVSDQLIIQGAGAGTIVRVLNILGQQMYSGVTSSNKAVIQTGEWPAGAYTLQLAGADGRHGGMTVVKE